MLIESRLTALEEVRGSNKKGKRTHGTDSSVGIMGCGV